MISRDVAGRWVCLSGAGWRRRRLTASADDELVSDDDVSANEQVTCWGSGGSEGDSEGQIRGVRANIFSVLELYMWCCCCCCC